MMKTKRIIGILFGVILLWLGLFTSGMNLHAKDDKGTLKRPGSSIIVPDRFLRRWDPVTIFFNGNRVPAGKTAEDHHEKYVTLSPDHPGAYTWLDRSTLQFRPAEPWPPLTRYSWKIDGRTVELATLMSTPVSTIPSNNSSNLSPVETFSMSFPEPVDPEALAKMINIELRPLPGVGDDEVRWLDHDDFDMKIMERRNRSDRAQYVLLMHNPIPMGIKATVHMRLSLEDDVEEAFYRVHFSTAEPFYITGFGSRGNIYPVTQKGVSYSKEQAIKCSPERGNIEVQFSSRPADIGPIEARSLVRFTPAVEDLKFKHYGNKLEISGRFKAETLYRVALEPTHLKDENGRELLMEGPSHLYVYFPLRESFLKWDTSKGVSELHGPQMVPLVGRGFERVDVRIYPVNPLNRSFWPFPSQPVRVNEDSRPPAPGEEPNPFDSPTNYISGDELSRQIKALGSPPVSVILPIPLKKDEKGAQFGLDLKPYFAQINGKGAPGTYLVGMRRLDGSKERHWIRVQVTDLCLTTVEESGYVEFVVTSLKTGTPVAGAQIKVEGSRYKNRKTVWENLVEGTTDSSGIFRWKAPGSTGNRGTVRRIVVSKKDDMLVLDPSRPPDEYADNRWAANNRTWLQWTQQSLVNRKDPEHKVCHVFTERPVYKPDEPVHIKGYIRHIKEGEFSFVTGKSFLVVDGPGDLEWRYPVTLSRMGSFYHKFDEEKLPTGVYRAALEYKGIRYKSVVFKKEAYRLPKFEVTLHGPDISGLDDPFKIQLTADYYAGGRVTKQPVRWRITQFPYTWKPDKLEGFIYSTDARFSGDERFRASPVKEKDGTTDEQGGAVIIIDPSIEPTAQPRLYVVEATVTGADDQTVSSTHQVKALPPFVLGVKTPRYLQEVKSISPEIIAAGPDGKLFPGQEIKVRLLQRQWHSFLQADDFSQNAAKYVTEVVDKKVFEKVIVSSDKPTKMKIPIDSAGVYIVELEASDRLGRTQVVSVDLFAGGDEPVTWSRPPSKVFEVTTEKKEYAPGETAKLILKSPFQRAKVLAVIETPEQNNSYKWVNVRKGTAVFELKIEKHYMPRIPVHFVLMRGRIDKDKSVSQTDLDLGKPTTLAATAWVEVSTDKHQVYTNLDYPSKALPGEEIQINISLADDLGEPLDGEVTLWLVDQSVLALGKEQRLDPLPDFIVSRQSYVSFHDTRNRAIGRLPFHELPGGDMEAKRAREMDLLDKVTVRQNFQPVPFYDPGIMVDKSGKASISVKLPDNLTNFKIRAKAISGPERFGFAEGHLSVRLPVIVQPSLPRFVRPGDEFTAVAIGRIVEGEGGAGSSEIRVEGLNLEGPSVKDFEWNVNEPERIEYQVGVPTPEYTDKGELSRTSITVTLGVERDSDKARDAFSVKLPIRADRKPIVERVISNLEKEKPVVLPAVTEPVRKGSLKRSLLVSGQPGLIKMAAGLDYLMNYPHGCTEQRISRARAILAAKRFRDLLYKQGGEDQIERAVSQTLLWIESAADSGGLVAYWPGNPGNVSLTAWVVQFMLEARNAGFPINEELFDKLIHTLKRSLRSDYTSFISGASYAERCWALTALADANELDEGYAAELARRSDYLDLESKAQVARVLYRSGEIDSPVMEGLIKDIWSDIVIRLYQGKEIYGGLQSNARSNISLILPSETRSVAQVLQTVSACDPKNVDKKRLLFEALVTLGQGDGWGSTNANGEALLALERYISEEDSVSPDKDDSMTINVTIGDQSTLIRLEHENSMHMISGPYKDEIRLGFHNGENQGPLVLRSEISYLPLADGSMVGASSQGFVVSRELLKIQEGDALAERIKLDKPGEVIELEVGTIIEEHIEVVNPKDRHYVAIAAPLAAGMESLNPNLATAPPEAKPTGRLTRAPTYVAFMDDQMAYYYNTLPKGTYHFYFRTKATIPGRYIQPVAFAEMMYDMAINGNGNGAVIVVSPKPKEGSE